jgi:hypothetical protein
LNELYHKFTLHFCLRRPWPCPLNVRAGRAKAGLLFWRQPTQVSISVAQALRARCTFIGPDETLHLVLLLADELLRKRWASRARLVR